MTKAINEGLRKYARRQASDATKLRYHADLPTSIRTMLWCYWGLRARWRSERPWRCPPAADGPTVFAHACKLGLEGIVSKRKDSAYRSGRPPDWLKMKNSDAPAVKREAEQDGRGRGVNDLSAGALIILAKSSALCIGLEGETGDFKCLIVNLKPRPQRGFSL